MATPVGHYLFGLSIAVLAARDADERRRAPWLAAVACAPDLDVLPGLAVGNLSLFHHGATHSFLAAGVAAVAAAGVVRYATGRLAFRLPLLVFALYTSHIALDAVTLDTTAPFGAPWFWPWSGETFQAPWMLLPNVQHTRQPLVSVHNALLMVREVLIFAPLLAFAHIARTSRRAWRNPTAWACGGSFATAAGLSIASLN